ncbi:MAG: response regulator [Verrucomicrobiota bacterium]
MRSDGYIIAGKRILLVDDDDDRRSLFADFLTVLQARCDMASTGVLGIEKMLNTTYDMIVLDVMLGPMLGWEVFKSVKQRKPDFQTPVLFLTNLGSDAEEAFRSLDAGKQCQLESKNISANDLVRVMEGMLI